MRGPMANDNQLDVVIAVYAMGTLGERDYEAIAELVEAKTAHGVLFATQDPVGETQVKEAGETPVDAGAVADAVAATGVGKGVKEKVEGVKDKVHDKVQDKVEDKLEEKIGEKLSPGSGMMIAVYEHAGADSVAVAIQNPMWSSIAAVDGHSPKALKAALQEAQAGLPGA